MIPTEWVVTRLKRVGQLVGGSGFPPDLQGQLDGDLPFYKVGDLSLSLDGRLMPAAQHWISLVTANQLRARIIPAHSIVWAKIGAALLLNRRRITTRDSCIDNNLTAFIPDGRLIVPEWGFYWMCSIDFGEHVKPGAVPSLSEGSQGELSFLLPPIRQQQQIVDYLKSKTFRIDALIIEQQRLIDLLKEKRRAVISHAVTKGLDPSALMRDSGSGLLGKIPSHWKVAKLGHLASKIGSGKTPKGGATAYVKQGVMFLRSQNVYDDGLRVESVVYIDADTDEEMRNSRVLPQDVLINITGASIGRSTIVPADFPAANVNQHVSIIRLRHPRKLANWLATVLQANYAKSLVHLAMTGAARDGLTGEELAQFRIPVPPAGERDAIVAHLDSLRTQWESLIDEANTSKLLLEERRSALISAAVTGQINVRGWQPPATEAGAEHGGPLVHG